MDDKKVETQQSSENDSKDVENLEEDFTNSDSDVISNEKESAAAGVEKKRDEQLMPATY